jgi:hypothetical protein
VSTPSPHVSRSATSRADVACDEAEQALVLRAVERLLVAARGGGGTAG